MRRVFYLVVMAGVLLAIELFKSEIMDAIKKAIES